MYPAHAAVSGRQSSLYCLLLLLAKMTLPSFTSGLKESKTFITGTGESTLGSL